MTWFTVLLILVAVAAGALGTCALVTTYAENDRRYDPGSSFYGITVGVCVLATLGAAIAASASRRKKP
jgi:amino acid transporter